ncbi:lasso peptide biosynthesis B2 protein [Bacillus sp. SD088]|uniref:lasso peptide biosynthesis B2 protein n=1 Tax=Bacillus sp. SD088 TaxID=2782012 RepID=UPI001A96E17F|nr:lasso peptide biosynthesis B2 protein [Bacillus sp. SD088]MBO0995918.1 lasso peptide biosynthesis B2 protein [Bacillus sp. SD088]
MASDNVRPRLLVLESILALTIAWILLRIFGVKCLKSRRKHYQHNVSWIKMVYETVLDVSQFIPFSCKCLEVASAVKLLAEFHRIKTNVILGVGTEPFTAHAWVACGNDFFGVDDSKSYKILGRF